MKRIFTLAIVALVVVSPILGVLPAAISGPVGSASAASTCGVDEYQNDTDRYGTADALMGQTGYRVGADTYAFSCQDLQNDLDYYQAASSMRTSYQSFTTVYDNSLSDSALGAYSEMEKAVLYAYDNGTSLSNAKLEAKSSFEDYYTVKERNYIENYRAIAYALDSWNQQATYDLFDIGTQFTWNSTWAGSIQSWDATVTGISTGSMTLANGSSVSIPLIDVRYQAHYYSSSNNVHKYLDENETINPLNGSTTNVFIDFASSGKETTYEHNIINVNPPPSTSYSTLGWLVFGTSNDRLSQIQSEYDNFNSAYGPYTEGIYNGLDTGEITYSDAISRATKVDTYLQQSADENASFNMAVVGLSGAGLDGVNVANTSYMTVNMSTETYDMPITRDGMLLSRGAPADGWQYGVEYHSDNITGGQMFVDLDGQEYTINGTFTIESAYGADGNEIDASDIQNPDADRLDTYNASDYVNLTQQLQEDINALEQKVTDDSGAGGGSGVDASGFFSALGNALTGLFGFVGSGGLTGALQGLMIVAGALIALTILLNALMP